MLCTAREDEDKADPFIAGGTTETPDGWIGNDPCRVAYPKVLINTIYFHTFLTYRITEQSKQAQRCGNFGLARNGGIWLAQSGLNLDRGGQL
jgi:hypothetical protein